MSKYLNYLESDQVKSILIIGASGGLAQIVIKLINDKFPDAQIIGVDSRAEKSSMNFENYSFMKIKYSRSTLEKIFREKSVDVVFLLTRLVHSRPGITASGMASHLDQNIKATKLLLDLSIRKNVKKLIVMSSFHVYGAKADNPVFLSEEDPLRASVQYPELRDVAEKDQLISSWMWKHQEQMQTVLLRPCNIIGAKINNAITKYLTSPVSPTPLDFKPMFQFIHEFDMAQVLVASITKLPSGVFNVAPREFISLNESRNIVGVTGVPTSVFLLSAAVKLIKKFGTGAPDYLADYLKYSCLIETKEIEKYLGKNFFRFNIRESLELLKITT